MEIKKGDLVRVSGVAPKIYLSRCDGLFVAFAGVVIDIEGDHALIKSIVHIEPAAKLAIPTKYLVKVDAEADAYEQLQEEYARFMGGRTPISFADIIERWHTQRRMRRISQDDFLKEINLAEHEVSTKPHYVPKIMFNTEFWVKYEADLAKELAISYAKRGKSPLDAVAAAKEITKRLKQK